MPIIKLATSIVLLGDFNNVYNGYVIPIDADSNNRASYDALKNANGVLDPLNQNSRIVFHQGIDSLNLDKKRNLLSENPDLYEKEYTVYVNHNYCFLADINNSDLPIIEPISVDDDGIAVYKFSQQVESNNNSSVRQIPTADIDNSPISGTKGSALQFKIIPNMNITNGTILTKYGTELELAHGKDFHCIRMPVRVVGSTTGYSADIHVLFAKLK